MRKTILVLFAAIVLVLVGCRQEEPQPTGTPEFTPQTAAPAEPAAEPTAVEVVEAEPENLQPRYEPLPPDICFVYPPEDIEVAVDYDCGYVVVPEFYEGKTTRIVKVPFLRFNSPNGTTASPVLRHPARWASSAGVLGVTGGECDTRL
jgi:hypothetical protein